MAREYVFVDEWDVDAPQEPVFAALADGRTYPDWWRPVYISVEGDENVTRHHFKGKLPYTLETRTQVVSKEPPDRVEVTVDGDLRGRGVWTLSRRDGLTHVRFEWTVFADKPILKVLTPVLRPLFRWNHAWAIARAREGLEPYARAQAFAPAD